MSPLSSDPERRERQLANLLPAPSTPIQPGEQRALSHGGYAEVAAARLDAKAQTIYDALAADVPLRDEEGEMQRHDSAMVALLATTLCRLDSIAEHLAERGMFDRRTKRVRPVVELESRLRKEAAAYMAELGLTPRSRVALGVDLARSKGRTLGEEARGRTAGARGPRGRDRGQAGRCRGDRDR